MKRMILHLSEISEVYLLASVDDLERVPNLESLHSHRIRPLFVALRGRQSRTPFNSWFGGRGDRRVCPDIRLVDLETGFGLTRENQKMQRDLAPEGVPRTLRVDGRVRGGGKGRSRGRLTRGGGGHFGRAGTTKACSSKIDQDILVV